MKLNRILPVFCVLSLVCLLGIWWSQQNWSGAQAANAQAVQQDQAGAGTQFEYAQVSYNESTTRVLIERGQTNIVPVEVELTVAIRQLGGTGQRATFANLLDLIGIQGWELVAIENGRWIFKRQR